MESEMLTQISEIGSMLLPFEGMKKQIDGIVSDMGYSTFN